ncbi:hypothetical protein Tcan_00187 [Toxocara canis]|uniref:Uncharacterized protein n=1 Tax=Toxocara canis TaxID=6265 RepID=A0A0B2UXH4_TOXCA|nr:hypothetical protein Tcan_00187 [Toxocara canis]
MNVKLWNDTYTFAFEETFDLVLEKTLNSSITVASPYPCAGKGLDCADLLTLHNLFVLLGIITRTVLAALMMIVSLTMIDTDNQLKHFIVNLFGICIPSDLLITTRQILMVADLFQSVFDLEWLAQL